jgi:hypothetical protein
MTVPRQSEIVAAIYWLTVVSQLIKGAMLPSSPLVSQSVHPFSWWIPLFGLLAPPVLALANVGEARKNPDRANYRPGFIGRWVDRHWGAGSAESFLRELRIGRLIGCGALVFGITALCFGHPAIAMPRLLEVALFAVFAGVGFLASGEVARRRVPSAWWA